MLLIQEAKLVEIANAIKGIGWPEAVVLAALILGVCYILGKMIGR